MFGHFNHVQVLISTPGWSCAWQWCWLSFLECFRIAIATSKGHLVWSSWWHGWKSALRIEIRYCLLFLILWRTILYYVDNVLISSSIYNCSIHQIIFCFVYSVPPSLFSLLVRLTLHVSRPGCFRQWKQGMGSRVCMLHGSSFNNPMTENGMWY